MIVLRRPALEKAGRFFLSSNAKKKYSHKANFYAGRVDETDVKKCKRQ